MFFLVLYFKALCTNGLLKRKSGSFNPGVPYLTCNAKLAHLNVAHEVAVSFINEQNKNGFDHLFVLFHLSSFSILDIDDKCDCWRVY